MTPSHPTDKGKKGASQPTAPELGETKFEAALSELEQIVLTMEDGRLPLEESISAYRRGSELLRHCQQQLGDAERKIQILEDGALRDFDSANGDSK
ncbi:MAG: exodeoxyribonuclease VII small subunit [Betaproteobacteria bacterium]